MSKALLAESFLFLSNSGISGGVINLENSF